MATCRGVAQPQFAGYDDLAFRWMCDAWPVPVVRGDTDVATVAAPTFVARRDLSPRQSTNALDVIRTAIPTVRVFDLRVPTSGGVMGAFPPCFADLRATFERDPAGPLDTASCERRESRIDFVPPSG